MAGATTIDEANRVLWDFLPRFNLRFGVASLEPNSAYRPAGPGLDLAGVLCFKHRRKVAKDNTVKYNWRTLQLLPTPDRPSYAGVRVEVQERLDGTLVVCYQGREILTQEAPPRLTALRALGREFIPSDSLPGSGHFNLQQRSPGLKPRRGAPDRADLDELLTSRSPEPGRARGNGASPHPAPRTPGRLPTPRQLDRWRAIQQAKRHGFSQRAIASWLGISRNTVRKYVSAGRPPTNPRQLPQSRNEEKITD